MRIAYLPQVGFDDHRMTYLQSLAREMAKRPDVEAHLIVPDGVESSVDRWRDSSGVVYRRYPNFDYYSVTGQMSSLSSSFFPILQGRFDILHVRPPVSGLFSCLVASWLRDGKVVYDYRGPWTAFLSSRRGDELVASSTLIRGLEGVEVDLMNRCACVIAISDKVRSDLRERGVGVPIYVVPVGVDLDLFSPGGERSAGGGSSLTLGYVGTVSQLRETEFLVRAFDDLLEEVEEARLLLVGPVEGVTEMRRLITERALGNRVRLLGRVPHSRIPEYMASFDVALSYLPSSDVFRGSRPIKILEYMAMGKPIVANRVEPHESFISHGENGLLFESGSTEDFVDKVRSLARDASLREEMSKSSRSSVAAYSFQNLGRRLWSVYEKIVST